MDARCGRFVTRRLHGGEKSAEENLAIPLYRNRGHAVIGVGIEFGIDGAVWIQSSDPVSRRGCEISGGMNGREPTADEDLVVHVHRQRQHRRVWIRLERHIQRACARGPKQISTVENDREVSGLNGAEIAAHQNAAVGLARQGEHLRLKGAATGNRNAADVERECGINAAIGIQPRDAAARHGRAAGIWP